MMRSIISVMFFGLMAFAISSCGDFCKTCTVTKVTENLGIETQTETTEEDYCGVELSQIESNSVRRDSTYNAGVLTKVVTTTYTCK